MTTAKNMKIRVIILTYNEEKHIARCIASVKSIATEIIVVDSYSTDSTVNIALGCSARVIQNKWVNHSAQFNWALTQLNSDTDWVLRIDADEKLSPKLALEIKLRIPLIGGDVYGIFLNRRIVFHGRLLKYGGLFPVKVLRLFRYGQGVCESRLMDEHIIVNGSTLNFTGEIIDDNLKPFSWWIDKHNNYASLEAVEILNLKYGFLSRNQLNFELISEVGFKRWIKEHIYVYLPKGFRAMIYFLYRYIVRFGFLDGNAGAAFHFFQGFWYRYLVDLKVDEVEMLMSKRGLKVKDAIALSMNIFL